MFDKLIAGPKAPLLLSLLNQSVESDGQKLKALGSRYSLDTEKGVRSAWKYLGKAQNAAGYTLDELKQAKAHVLEAAAKLGIAISPEAQSALNQVPELELTQSHYNIEGSCEEHLSKVNLAFRAWRKAHAELIGDYYWASILGVFADGVCFYTDSYSAGYSYYFLGYKTDIGGEIIFDDEPESANVKLVMERLGVEPTEEQAMEDKDKKTPAEQDAVGTDDTTISAAASAAKGVGTSAENPDLNTNKKTDAESSGSSVAEPADEAASGSGVETSDEIPSGTAPATGTSGAVDASLGKTAAGSKQDASIEMTEENLLQGDPFDHGGMSLGFVQSTSTEEKDGQKLMHLQCVVTRGDMVNSKGQVYPTSVWKKCLPKMNQAAKSGKFLGKLEHPENEQGLMDAAIKWDKFWLQDNDVWAEATIVPTDPHGKNLQALIEAGVQVDFSSRGYGSSKVQDWRGTERVVIQDDFICTAFDAVWKGASVSGVKDIKYQSDDPTSEESKETQVEDNKTDTKVQSAATPTAEERAAAIRAERDLNQTRVALLEKAGLSDLGQNAYSKALEGCKTIDELMAQSDTILPVLEATFPKANAASTETQSETYVPTFFVKQSAEELAPHTVGELFDRLVQDLPDAPIPVPGIPNHFTSQRAACRRMMVNIANERQGAFSGRNAAMSLLALEQGKIDRAQDILTQALATGATVAASNVDGDGAPLSNYLIFPLIRRVFPQYIMNEIAAIQPLDRPEGKIFYLDHYRTEDPEGNEKRLDLNTSASPFNSSYADNATEGAAAKLMRLRLAGVTVTAHTKKLGAAWSIEEMQDLRAYHGLDAAQELVGAIAREMALEWNMEVLNDMLAQATAADLTFGTTAPASGFAAQKDWDEYVWVYLQKLDNMIFARRNGPMTHLVVGVDAALALAKSMRGAFTIGGDSRENATDMEMYPGTTFYGTVNTPNGSRYKVFKTNFWSEGTTNASKILGLRKGSEWSDTPYIWAPYTDYVTPMLTDPADFSQKQGIISRAAKKVVVADAMGKLTVSATQGVVL